MIVGYFFPLLSRNLKEKVKLRPKLARVQAEMEGNSSLLQEAPSAYLLKSRFIENSVIQNIAS